MGLTYFCSKFIFHSCLFHSIAQQTFELFQAGKFFIFIFTLAQWLNVTRVACHRPHISSYRAGVIKLFETLATLGNSVLFIETIKIKN